MTGPRRLKVLIAGGGIGGLSAAIALRLQGHEVEIFEKSRLHSEVGAAVYSAPNCTAALRHLDIYPEKIGGVVHVGIKFLDANCEQKFSKVFSEEERSGWQDEWFLVNRIDLHNALKQKALSTDGPGQPVTIHTSAAVDSIDCEEATIRLADGTTVVTGDVVIGADGIHSRTRLYVTGREVPLISSGKCCYRTLIPTADLLADQDTARFVETPGTFVQVAAADRRICLYPCSGGKSTNLAIFVPRGEVGDIKKGATGYDQSANKKQVLSHFKTFSPPVLHMLDKATEDGVKLWDLQDMELLPSLIKGKAVLIGDAAHPFLPHMGQGAAQAIEDSCALGVVLPAGTLPEEIPRRLELWQQCRKERAHKIIEYTRHRAREADGSQGPPQTVDEFTAATQYCINHDAWIHAEKEYQDWIDRAKEAKTG